MPLFEVISFFLVWDYFKRNEREREFWQVLGVVAGLIVVASVGLLSYNEYQEYRVRVGRSAFEALLIAEHAAIDRSGLEVESTLIEALQKDRYAWQFYHQMRTSHNITLVDRDGNAIFPRGGSTGWRVKRGGADDGQTWNVFIGFNGFNGTDGHSTVVSRADDGQPWNVFVGVDGPDGPPAVVEDLKKGDPASVIGVVDGVELLNALRAELDDLKRRFNESGL